MEFFKDESKSPGSDDGARSSEARRSSGVHFSPEAVDDARHSADAAEHRLAREKAAASKKLEPDKKVRRSITEMMADEAPEAVADARKFASMEAYRDQVAREESRARRDSKREARSVNFDSATEAEAATGHGSGSSSPDGTNGRSNVRIPGSTEVSEGGGSFSSDDEKQAARQKILKRQKTGARRWSPAPSMRLKSLRLGLSHYELPCRSHVCGEERAAHAKGMCKADAS